MLIEILIPLVAFGAVAPAKAPMVFCANSQAIAVASEICMFNDAYVKQARACLTKLDTLSQDAAATMAKGFAPDAAAAQASKFSATGADYASSLLTLESLVATNKLAIREVEGYLRDLIHPLDDTDSMSVPCYGDNFRGVSLALKDFKAKLAQLERARAAAAAKGGTSLARETNLTGSLNAPAAVHGRAGSEPIPRAAAPRPAASDITGTKPKTP